MAAHILLVEDDPDVRPVMEYLFNAEGHRVTAVECLTRAFELLASRHFDLVVTDAVLPDGNGLGVADRAADLGISALVVTAYRPYLRKPGARYHFLFKPLRPAELLKAVRSRLAGESAQIIPFPQP
ncbi:MAG TPA: response regulator [Stellaceae bacterium]|nr:response regulator [Stellaceae bacterium]